MSETGPSDCTLTDDELREMHAAARARRLRIRHPYVFDLIKVLGPSERLERRIVLTLIRQNLERARLPVPASLNELVQVTLQHYCADSAVFRRRGASPGDALFCWPEGKSAGIWALLRDNAASVLRECRRQLREPPP